METTARNSELSNVVIRPPREPEWPACRMLLPEAFAHGQKPECLLALTQRPLRLLGAACFHYGEGVIYAARVRVVRTHRRRGVGARLIAEIAACARKRRAHEVRGQADASLRSAAEPFLLANGFVRQNRLVTFQSDWEVISKPVAALRDQLVARGKIPAGARVVTPTGALLGHVGRLYRQYIAYNRDFPAELIAAQLESGRLESRVLLLNGQPEGMILGGWKGRFCKVYGEVVTPSLRGGWGWANVMLWKEAMQWGHANGARRLEFDVLDANRTVMKFASRLRADVVAEKDTYVLRLDPETGAA